MTSSRRFQFLRYAGFKRNYSIVQDSSDDSRAGHAHVEARSSEILHLPLLSQGGERTFENKG